MNPLTHLRASSARFMHHATVISSLMSCVNSRGRIRVVTSLSDAVFRTFLQSWSGVVR